MDKRYFLRWATCFWSVLALLAVLICGARVWSVVHDGPDAGEITGYEEISIFNISRVRYGAPPYGNCFAYPYQVSVFNWLFYSWYGSIAAWAQPSERTLPTLLRLVSLGWALAGCLAMFLYLKRYAGSLKVPSRTGLILAAGVSVVAWLGPNIGWWALNVRPDVAALCCETLGLLVILRQGSRWPQGHALLAAVLFFFGWSFKQSAVGFFLGVLLALILRREWTCVLLLLVGFSGLVGLVLLVSGQIYYENVFISPALAPWVQQMVLQNAGLWIYFWGFVLLILPAVLLLCYQPGDRWRLLRTGPLLIVLGVLITSFATSALASGRFGAWSNYYFEPWIAGMLLTGLVFQHAAAEFQAFAFRLDRRAFAWCATAILLLATAYTLCAFEPPFAWDGVRLIPDPYPASNLEAVQRSAWPLFCDDPRLLRLALGAESRDIPVIDCTLYGDALKSGHIRDGGLAARIENRWFATLWLHPGKSPWEEVAIQAGYCLAMDGALRKYVRPGE
jgi:hypothetical protein